MYRARVLNTNDETIVHHNSLSHVLPVASIPNEFEDVDIERAEQSLSSDDLERLWNQQANPLNDDERLYQYWHNCLQHPPKVMMKHLAKRGIIPSRLAKLKSHPIYAACVFTKAHKRPWRHKSKRKFIRKADENFPGGGTSMQPSLIL